MWDFIFKYVPPPLLLGLIVYSCVTFLWLQPLVERRMADRIYVPQCEAGTLPSASPPQSSPPSTAPLADNAPAPVPVPVVKLPLGVQIVAALKDMLGADGTYSVPAGALTANPCLCSVSVAFDSVFWRSHIHVMSLRTYTPRAIEHFGERVAQVLGSGICGHRG